MEILKQYLVELVALSFILVAVVAWLKQLGLKGQNLTVSAFAFGLVFGLAYRYALVPMTDFAAWFWAAVFGLLCGLLATGAYKAGESMTGGLIVKQQAPLIEAAYKDYSPEDEPDQEERA